MRVPKTQLPRHMNVAAVRNIDGGSYLEAFLVSAVAAILVIRLYLELTGYPQIGGGGIHVAHVLWGGLLMLIAQVMLLAFLGKHVKDRKSTRLNSSH